MLPCCPFEAVEVSIRGRENVSEKGGMGTVDCYIWLPEEEIITSFQPHQADETTFK